MYNCHSFQYFFKKVLSNTEFADKIYTVYIYCRYGEIGEVVNTADCGSVIQGFDPLISPHIDFYSHLARYK